MITKTKIDGKWVLDAQKDYSNGSKPVKQNQAPEVAKLMSQHKAMSACLGRISKLTSAKAIHQEVANLRNAWPTL